MFENFADSFEDLTIEIKKMSTNRKKHPKMNKLREIEEKNPFPNFGSKEGKESFNFDLESIKFIVETEISDSKDKEFCGFFLLFSFLAWTEEREEKQAEETVIVLIKAISKFFDSNQLFCDVFLVLTKFYLNFEKQSELEEIRDIFIKYLEFKDGNATENDLNLIPAFLKNFDNKFINFCSLYLQKFNLNSEIASKIIQCIEQNIEEMDKNVINLFKVSFKALERQQKRKIAKKFALSIIDKVYNSDFELTVNVLTKIPTLKAFSEKGRTVSFALIKEKTFENGFDVFNVKKFDTDIKNIKLIDEKIWEKAKEYILALKDEETWGATIINEIADNFNEATERGKFGELYSLLLHISEATEVFCIEHILSTAIFNTSEATRNVTALIAFAMQLILKNGESGLLFAFNNTVLFPNIYETLISYCISVFDDIATILTNSEEFITVIIKSLKHYQKLRIEGNKEFEEVTLLIFKLLSLLLTDKKAADFIFNEMFLSSIVFSFVFEEPIRCFIFDEIEKYIIAGDSKIDKIALLTKNTFDIHKLNFPEQNAVKFFVDTLSMLKSSFAKNPSIVDAFTDTFMIALSCHKVLRHTELINDLIYEIIEIMPYYAKIITKEQFSSLNESLYTINPLPHNIKCSLIRFAAGNREITYGDLFAINDARPLVIMFSILFSQGCIIDSCKYLDELLKYSLKNNFVLHKTEFDHILVRLLKEVWFDTEKSEIVDSVLGIIERIAALYSSPLLVQYLFALFNIRKEEKRSTYIVKVLELVNRLLLKEQQTPQKFEFLHENEHTFKQMKVPTGFTFVCFVYAARNEEKYLPSIFSTKGINLFADKFDLIFQNNDKETRIENALKENEWNIVTLSMEEKKATIIVNDKNESFETDFDSSPITFNVGGAINDSENPSEPFLLGNFAVYPLLTNEKAKELQNAFPESLSEVNPEPLLFVDEFNRFKKYPNLVNALIKNCRFELVLPLFTITDIGYDTSILIIKRMLSLGEENEETFLEIGGFKILSHLLTKGPAKLCNYQLYLKFFNLLTVIKNNRLQIQLIDQILLNSNIWIVAEGEEQLLIHIHWANELVPTFMSVVAQVRSFSRLLNQYAFFYDTCSSALSLRMQFNPVPSNFNLNESRSLFTTILSLISLFSFTKEDFNLIISYCISHPDHSLSQYTLRTLKTIIFRTPSPVAKFGVDIINGLLPLSEVPNAAPTVFSMICYLVKEKIIDFNMQTVLNEFLPKFCIKTMQQFKSLIETMNNYPEMIMICFIAAGMIGSEAIEYFIENVKPSECFSDVNLWYIWPLYVIHKTANDVREGLIRFLVLCNTKQWLEIYAAIGIVSTVKDNNGDAIKAQFISTIAKCFLDGSAELNRTNINSFIYIVKDFVFFGKGGITSRSLMAAILDSPFANDVDIDITSMFQTNRNVHHPDRITDFIEMLGKMEIDEERDYSYNLRLDINGDWIDADLCLNILNVLEKTECTSLDLIICFYLTKIYADKVYHHLQQINVPSELQPILNIIRTKIGLEKDNKETNIQMKKNENYYAVFESFINSWTPEILISNEKAIISKINEVFGTKIATTKLDLVSVWPLSLDASVRREAGKSHENKKLWMSLYGFLQVTSISWKETFQFHYMRDNTFCYGLCPFKTKTNWDFQDHSEAAAETAIGTEYTVVQKKKDDSRVKCANRNGSLLSVSCISVDITKNTNSEILIFRDHILIWYSDGRSKKIMFTEIAQVNHATYLHHNNSLIVLTTTGKTYLWSFKSTKIRDTISELLGGIIPWERVRRSIFIGNDDPMTKKWCNGEISNFSYLMYLNISAGRIHTCASQYPIMPWVLTDYTSESIDLNNPEIYRDFTKPVGALEPNRLNKLKKLMSSLEKVGHKGYLYSNGPNCPLTLFLQLLRMEPFTSLHIDIQAGKFDCPERIFSSIPELYRTVLNDMNDFRELIPEFFYCPEFLKNINHFNLGLDDEICPKGDVVLPPWCSSALEFVYLHRKALESDYVSRNIHNWIDLMFGYKQRGEEAVKASNVYNPDLYDTVWDRKEGELTQEEQNTIELGLEHMGQIPAQLFDKPHPQKIIKEKHISKKYSYRMVAPEKNISIEEATLMFEEDSVGVIGYSNNTAYFITDEIFDIIKGTTKFAGFGNDFVVFNSGYIFKDKIIKAKNKMSKFSYSPSMSASVGDDGIVRVFKNNFEVCRSFPFYGGVCSALSISSQFQTLAAATKGSIYLFSINNGETKEVRFQNGNYTPSMITVTNSWGFIVSCGTIGERSYIEVHTINGDFVTSVITNEIVTSMKSVSSNKGFDYIVFGCQSGAVYVTEAMYLKIDEPFVKYNEPIIVADFSNRKSSLVSLTKSTTLHFYPCSFL